jgi:hypothetical protein
VAGPLAALAAVLVACGSEVVPTTPPAPATFADLTGPWQSVPLFLDPALVGRAVDACGRDLELVGATAAIVDARGAHVVTVRLTGNHPGSCDALEIDAAGQIVGAGAGWSQNGPETLQPLPATGLGGFETQLIEGGGLKVRGWSVYGRVGPAISAVQIIPAGRDPVTATVGNGWFAAWWPWTGAGPAPGAGPGQFFPPFLARGFDGSGGVVSEARH